MPTARPRHAITETDEVAAALDAAARRWPELAGQRAKLLLRLVGEGHLALQRVDLAWTDRRVAALLETSGSFAEDFGPGYLDEVREDWPA